MKNLRDFLFIFFLVSISFHTSGQFSVNTSVTATTMVQNLLGIGVNTTNITSTLIPSAFGTFTATSSSGLGIQSGILLSTGQVNNLNQPFNYFNSANFSGAGDSDLDQIVAPLLTHDAQVLEFDFIAASDSISFNFIFASEEYNDYVGTSHTDVFAFYVSGPGYPQPTNIALIPGSLVPVTINNVNNGYATGASAGPCTNCNYYRDNYNNNAVNFSFDGLTTVLNAKFKVMPCESYHFKIAIADTDDEVFDSMILLEEGTFSLIAPIATYYNGSPVDTVYMCPGDSITISGTNASNYSWSTGDSTQSIVVTQPGQYQYTVTNGVCFAYSEVDILSVMPTPQIAQNGDTLSLQTVLLPGMSCQWNMGGVPIPLETQPSYVATGFGCYTLTLYQDSCEALSNTICITGLNNSDFPGDKVHIFPNPATGNFTLELGVSEYSLTRIKLFDITGRILFEKSFIGNSAKVERNGFSSGLYWLEISNEDYSGFITRKLVYE